MRRKTFGIYRYVALLVPSAYSAASTSMPHMQKGAKVLVRIAARVAKVSKVVMRMVPHLGKGGGTPHAGQKSPTTGATTPKKRSKVPTADNGIIGKGSHSPNADGGTHGKGFKKSEADNSELAKGWESPHAERGTIGKRSIHSYFGWWLHRLLENGSKRPSVDCGKPW